MRTVLRKLGFMNTARALRWDIVRLGARLRTGRMLKKLLRSGPLPTRLHLGSGEKKVKGWLNCDVVGTDVDIDLSIGKLPFPDNHFEAAAAQQVIEHLHLTEELQPLLDEIHRCLQAGGEVWLSCPDMEKVCRSYLADGGEGLLRDKLSRWPNYSTGGYQVSQIVNDIFHQYGQHKNLFDFSLLRDTLMKAGFKNVTRCEEADMLSRFPEFPPRRDDFHAIYVSAEK